MKKILLTAITTLLLTCTQFFVLANSATVNIRVPTPNGGATIEPSQVSSNQGNFVGFIQLINKYLWVVLVVVAMIALIYAGFKLITQGAEKLKEAINILLGTFIGILIAVFAYALIRLLANLF